jgi:tripartite-type tricarboxylate transporter receptor subunit TctC
MPRNYSLSRGPVTLASIAAMLIISSCAPAATPAPTAAPSVEPTAASTTAPAAKTTGAPTVAGAAPAAKSTNQPVVDSEAMARHFRGKTVTITVGYAPGGGHDTYARILSVHLPQYIPGNPAVVVSNKPGADSLIAANGTIQAPPDGLNIGAFHISLLLQWLLGKQSEGFDPTNLIYLGNPDVAPTSQHLCARPEVASDLDAFLKSSRKLRIGETGPGTNPAPLMEWLALVGMPIEVVYGYGGTAEIRAAFDRKELDLTNRCGDSDVVSMPQWVTGGGAVPLLYISQPQKWVKVAQAEGKFPWYKEILETAQPTPTQKATLETYLSWNGTKTYALPPKTPPDIVATLSKAFADTISDPATQEDLLKREQEVGLRTGDELMRQLQDFAKLPPDVVATFKAIHGIR